MFHAKKTVLLASLLALCWAAETAAAEDLKIGFVDQRRAVYNSDSGKRAEKTLTSLLEAKKGEIKPREDELKKLLEDFESQKFVLSKDALTEKQIELEKRRRDLERDRTAAEEEMQIEQRKLLAPLVEQFSKAVEEVGKEKGFDIIMDRSSPGILYYQDALDVTDLVIKRLNSN